MEKPKEDINDPKGEQPFVKKAALVKPELKKPETSEAAEAKPKTKPVKVTASSDLASNLESLHEKLEKLEDTVDRLRRRTPSVFGRFLSDLAKVILLAALLAVAWQTGLIDRFLEWVTSLDLNFGVDPFSVPEGGSEPPNQ